MHQTAQRNQLASPPYRTDRRKKTFESEANNRLVAARVESVQSNGLSGDRSKNSQAHRMGAKPSPYQPGHQVELLHLQAEADALILTLQAAGQKQMAESQAL